MSAQCVFAALLSPLLAQSRHFVGEFQCPLLGCLS